MHLILHIALFSSELRSLNPTVFFVDQLSAGIPLLRLLCSGPRVLFYCHFPDKLLAKPGSILKTLYRIPFDTLERWSTGCSDSIVVNSKFTRSVFSSAFPSLAHRQPNVVYPCVDTKDPAPSSDPNDVYFKGQKIVLSINRFERKKDIGLAIRAFAALPDQIRNKSRLIIAGGYDRRVQENVSYLKQLETLAHSLGLQTRTHNAIITALETPQHVPVIFLPNITAVVKANLLRAASLVVYTPQNEHLGIVPLEAMLSGAPVLAATQGGPKETVVDGQTGWLRDVRDTQAWTDVMQKVLGGDIPNAELQRFGYRGRQRVKSLFSQNKMAEVLDQEIAQMLTANSRPAMFDGRIAIVAGVAVAVVAAWYMRNISW